MCGLMILMADTGLSSRSIVSRRLQWTLVRVAIGLRPSAHSSMTLILSETVAFLTVQIRTVAPSFVSSTFAEILKGESSPAVATHSHNKRQSVSLKFSDATRAVADSIE